MPGIIKHFSLPLKVGISNRERKFRTSGRVTILAESRIAPLIKGAIVRSFNPESVEYYLTLHENLTGLQRFYIPEERLIAEEV